MARAEHDQNGLALAEMIGDDWYLHGDWGIEVPEPAADAEQPLRLPS